MIRIHQQGNVMLGEKASDTLGMMRKMTMIKAGQELDESSTKSLTGSREDAEPEIPSMKEVAA
jgi:hypothetical protein